MAGRGLSMGLVLAVAAALFAHASAQTPGCTTAIISLSPCLGFITGNSSAPSPSCCTQLSSVVQTQMQCLCTLLNGGASSVGLNINQTQALALPGACNITTAPLSQCNAAAGPATSPAATPPTTPSTVPSNPTDVTPTATPPTTPSTGPSNPTDETPAATPSVTPRGSSTPSTGSKDTPSSQSSDGSSNRSSLMVIATLFVVACVSSLV